MFRGDGNTGIRASTTGFSLALCLLGRYYITEGSNFGADFLVYPGDPMLYHAQFCVRIMGEEPLKPHLLAAAARGSHAARKQLLLACVSGEGPEYVVQYLTIAPETGWGVMGGYAP